MGGKNFVTGLGSRHQDRFMGSGLGLGGGAIGLAPPPELKLEFSLGRSASKICPLTRATTPASSRCWPTPPATWLSNWRIEPVGCWLSGSN